MRLALATCAKYPELDVDDQALRTAIARRGWTADILVWNQPADWSAYDAVVIRSVWDYWQHYRLFLDWLTQLESAGVALFNPAQVLRWNSHKSYLRQLEGEGIQLPPTLWIEPALSADPAAHFALTRDVPDRWGDEWVLKPALSGGANLTFRVTRAQASRHDPALREILDRGTAMLQPFLPQILTEGEVSFLFYGDQFSHAVRKRGPADEFRVQGTYGGSVEIYDAGIEDIAAALRALQAGHRCAECDSPWLYARVDMLWVASKWLLMELEVSEPNLFFLQDISAVDRFLRVLEASLK